MYRPFVSVFSISFILLMVFSSCRKEIAQGQMVKPEVHLEGVWQISKITYVRLEDNVEIANLYQENVGHVFLDKGGKGNITLNVAGMAMEGEIRNWSNTESSITIQADLSTNPIGGGVQTVTWQILTSTNNLQVWFERRTFIENNKNVVEEYTYYLTR